MRNTTGSWMPSRRRRGSRSMPDSAGRLQSSTITSASVPSATEASMLGAVGEALDGEAEVDQLARRGLAVIVVVVDEDQADAVVGAVSRHRDWARDLNWATQTRFPSSVLSSLFTSYARVPNCRVWTSG